MSQPTPLPEPFKWFANEYVGYTKDALLTYGRKEYERGLEDAAQICDGLPDHWGAELIAQGIRALKGKS